MRFLTRQFPSRRLKGGRLGTEAESSVLRKTASAGRFRVFVRLVVVLAVSIPAAATPAADEPADLILHSGRIVTVDDNFSVAEAMSVRGQRILTVGTNAQVLRDQGPQTQLVDLGGKSVLPGLIDSHVHAVDASLYEFDHDVPEMETIPDVLAYVRQRAQIVPQGEWIVLSQVFLTRLREQRFPTRAELDAAAPLHPVAFRTGPDASVNTLALKAGGIDRDFDPGDTGRVEKDPETGEPTGILRSFGRYLKVNTPSVKATQAQRDERLLALLNDYASVGITSVIDRSCSLSEQEAYQRLHAAGKLPIRVMLSRSLNVGQKTRDVVADLDEIAADPLVAGDDMLRIIGVKVFLDGGMLTGSAYMQQPWGVSGIYGIDDPTYRGLLYIEHDTLVAAVRGAVERNLAFTAHSVGDGAVHALLDAYDEVNKTTPVAPTHSTITHSNFMSREAIDRCVRLGVPVDIQPAWLYLDGRTLLAQFGEDRLRYFQPLRSLFEAGAIVGGGSDHMQKIGSLRSVNPYDPWLGLWITITRQPRWLDHPLHPEEALTREQALRMYTSNNAVLLRLEDRLGTLTPGKLADFIVVDSPVLECATDRLRDVSVTAAYVDGRPRNLRR